MSDEKFNFTDEIEEANWKLLIPHHERGAVFIVSENVDISLVAQAMSRDNVSAVEAWLDRQELRKPSEEEIQRWESDSESKKFLFIIVQPYVIIQLKTKKLQ